MIGLGELGWLISAFSIGFSIGLAQWFFALRNIPQSFQWVWFSGMGSLIGCVGGGVAFMLMMGESGLGFMDSSLEASIAGAITTCLYGAMTGFALVPLVQRSR